MRPNLNGNATAVLPQGDESLSGLNLASLQVSPSEVLAAPRSIFNGSVPPGTTLMSKNGRYRASFQANGNFVVYDTTKTGARAVIWQSGTDGKSAGGSLRVQPDGNLVIRGADGNPDWDSETSHDGAALGPREYELVMEDNGNLTLFDIGVGLPLWSNGERIARGDELSENWSDTRALEYIASYPDLMNQLGPEGDRGQSHFNETGISENRTTTFSATDYLAANQDLIDEFGDDTEKAAEHWIDMGRFEGRPLAPGAAPEEPVPALVFTDISSNGLGTITLPNGEEIKGGVENYGEYSQTGRGTVKLDDGRRFVVERDEGIPFPSEDLGSSLTSGHLETNQSLTSENGRYQAVYQSDGNFVVIDRDHPEGARAIWATETQGDAELGTVAIQRDGNLVVYDSFGKNTLPENAEWSSSTHHEDGEANRDFTLTMGNNGELVITDSENDGATLWTSGGGHIQDAPGIPRATATEIRGEDEALEATDAEPFLIDGAAYEADMPEGAVPTDYQDAVIQLMSWYTTGFISDAQFETWSNDLEVLSGLQQVIDNDGGRFDIADSVELPLREIADMTHAQIGEALDRGFDLETGPDADQLAALNSLAKGNDTAFIEVLTAWTLRENPDLELQFSTRSINNGGRDGSISFSGEDGAVTSPFITWLDERFNVNDGDLLRSLSQKEFTTKEGRRTVTKNVIGSDGDGGLQGSASLTPSLDVIQQISTEAEAQAVYDILGVSAAFGEDPARTGKGEMVADDGQVLGHSFSVRHNDNKDLFEGFGSNMARDAIEAFAPDAVGGTTTFLINAQNEVVENRSALGNMTVVEQGGSGNTVIAGAGDLTYSTTGATEGILRPGGGDANIIADDSNALRIEDVVDRQDNATVVRYTGDNTGTFQFADDGVNAVTIEEGTTQGFVIQANGTIRIELASGADVSESLFLFDGSDGTFATQDGSTLTASTVFGSDEEDEFIFNGEVKGTLVRTNDGNDYIEIGETFVGDFDVRDSASSWMWANGDEIFENDTVVINGSVSETMQDEGWTLVEGEGGGADKLIRYDTPDADGNREILAQITLSGDSEQIENILVSDGSGEFTSLQEIPPEVKTKLAALGIISQALMIVGAFFPPAAIAGAVTKFVYDAANDDLSFGNALVTAASVASAGNGIGGVGGGNAIAPAWVAPALSAGANALEGDWGSFTKNLFLTGAGLQAQNVLGLKDVPVNFAKIAETTEAAIVTVEGLTAEDGYQIAEGIFLLGVSVGPDGSRQLLLGGADAARIGQAIESGSLSSVFSATAGFLANQGIFNQEAEFIEDTPLLEPFDENFVVGGLNAISVVLGIDEAINNGDSTGQALVDAFPGILETATNFTGQNPVQVFFADQNDEVHGRNNFGGNEQLIVVYDDEADPDHPAPLSIHGADGQEIGEIEEAWNGSYNFLLPNENGELEFAFNHNPGTGAEPTEDRAPTQAEIDETDPIDLPEDESVLVASRDITAAQLEAGGLTQGEFDALTDQQQELFLYALDFAAGDRSIEYSPRDILELVDKVPTLSPSALDTFVTDLLRIDELTDADETVGHAFGVNLLGSIWKASETEDRQRLRDSIERKYEDGSLTELLGSFVPATQGFDLGSPPPGADQLNLIIEGIDNPELQADYRYIADNDFSRMYNSVPQNFEVSKAEFNALPDYAQIGLIISDHDFIAEAAQYEDNFTQQRILSYVIISTAMESPERFLASVLENPAGFFGQFAAEEIVEKFVPGVDLLEFGQLGINFAGNFITLDGQGEAYLTAETPEERAEALRGVVGATAQTVDPAVGFAATTGGFRVLKLGGKAALSTYNAASGANSNQNTANNGQPQSANDPAGGTANETGPVTLPDGTVLPSGSEIVESDANVGGVLGTFYTDDVGVLNFTYIDVDGVRQGFNLAGSNLEDGRAIVAEEFTIDVDATSVEDATNVTTPEQTTAPVEPVITDVTDGLVAGTVTTTTENDVVQVEYTDAEGMTQSFDLDAGTTPAQASEVLQFRFLSGQLDGLEPGSDPLTLVDGQTVDVIQTDDSWFARVDGEVTELTDASTRDEATSQIRTRGTNGTLGGANTVSTTGRAEIGGTEALAPYDLSLSAPSQTGAGGITATYVIGGETYTVDVPGDQAATYQQAETWLADQLEQGALTGLQPASQREVSEAPTTSPGDTPETTPAADLENATPETAEGAEETANTVEDTPEVDIPDDALNPPVGDNGTGTTEPLPSPPGVQTVAFGDFEGSITDPNLSDDGQSRLTYTINQQTYEVPVDLDVSDLDTTTPDYAAQFDSRATEALETLLEEPGALEGLSPTIAETSGNESAASETTDPSDTPTPQSNAPSDAEPPTDAGGPDDGSGGDNNNGAPDNEVVATPPTDSGNIDSTSPVDITSISPDPNLNASNEGGGRRDWTDAELQEIRDFRADNNGALPDGIGIADLPTSFIEEIANTTNAENQTESSAQVATDDNVESDTAAEGRSEADSGVNAEDQNEVSQITTPDSDTIQQNNDTTTNESSPGSTVDRPQNDAGNPENVSDQQATSSVVKPEDWRTASPDLTDGQREELSSIFNQLNLSDPYERFDIAQRVAAGEDATTLSLASADRASGGFRSSPEATGRAPLSDAQVQEIDALIDGSLAIGSLENRTAIDTRVRNGQSPTDAVEAVRNDTNTLQQILENVELDISGVSETQSTALEGIYRDLPGLSEGEQIVIESKVAAGADPLVAIAELFDETNSQVSLAPTSNDTGETVAENDDEVGNPSTGESESGLGNTPVPSVSLADVEQTPLPSLPTIGFADPNDFAEFPNTWTNLSELTPDTLATYDLSTVRSEQRAVLDALVSTPQGDAVRALSSQTFESQVEATRVISQAIHDLTIVATESGAQEVEVNIFSYESLDGTVHVGDSLSIGLAEGVEIPLLQQSMLDARHVMMHHNHPVGAGYDAEFGFFPSLQTSLSGSNLTGENPQPGSDVDASYSLFESLSSNGFNELRTVGISSINNISGEIVSARFNQRRIPLDVAYIPGSSFLDALQSGDGQLTHAVLPNIIHIGDGPNTAYNTFLNMDPETLASFGASSQESITQIENKFYEYFFDLSPDEVAALQPYQNQFPTSIEQLPDAEERVAESQVPVEITPELQALIDDGWTLINPIDGESNGDSGTSVDPTSPDGPNTPATPATDGGNIDPTAPNIESISPVDITSISPDPNLDASNEGGGRRDWTDAELQEIREFRAENNGALPEGIGIADLPTSFIREIAGEADLATSDPSEIVQVETGITLPDDWRNAVGGLTETQQSELANTFAQLGISDPYSRVEIAESFAAGDDLLTVSITSAGGIRTMPDATDVGTLTEEQVSQIDAQIADSPSLNSATNRTAIETRVSNGLTVTEAVNSVSSETNVLLGNLNQPGGLGAHDIAEADLVTLEQIYETLPGLSEGEQIAIETKVGAGLSPLEATAEYLGEARIVIPEPVSNSLISAIEANELAAGITDPGEIKYSVRLPGFPASVDYTRTSQLYTDALTGSLVEGALNKAENGTPLPTFSQYARSLGDLRAQQSGTVSGSDPNGNYGELRTPNDSVLQTEIRGRYEPYRQRILDRALQAAPFLQDNPNGGTAFIDGSDYGITNLSSLQVIPPPDGDGRSEVTFLSVRDVDLNRGREVLDALFVEAQQAAPEDAMDKIAEFAWVFYQVAPYTNGTAAIGQWTITSLMNAFGADYTALKPGVALDLEAIASSRESFIERFPTLFEGYQPPQNTPVSPVVLENMPAPIDEIGQPFEDTIPAADIDESGSDDLNDVPPVNLEDTTAPIDEGNAPQNESDPELSSGNVDPTDTSGEPVPDTSTVIPPLPSENPIDATTINLDPVVEPIADVDLADLDFENPVPIDLRTDPGDIVLSPGGNIEALQPFDFWNYDEPLRAPEIGENIPDTPFNPIKIVLDAANQGVDAGRNAAVQAFDVVGARLMQTGGFQWLLGQSAFYNDISSNITYDENGNATIDTTQVTPDLLDRLSEARLDPRISLSLGTSLPIASSPGLAGTSIFASPRTIQRLRRDFPQLMQALRGGDMATVRTILGEAFGFSGDALQGLLDPQVTNTVLQMLADRGLDGIPLPAPVQYAIDSLAIGRNGYFLIKSQTLNSSDAFVSLPNGGWSLTGREIQQTELGTVPALNSAGRPTQAGDFILDVDLPLDEAAIQAKIGPLFMHTEFSRGDLEKLGRTLTIPAGTPIPGSLYSFIESRISNPVNITTFSSPGVPFANSQRVYIRARDFEFRVDKLDSQPVTRKMIEETLLHLNGFDDPDYLSTGDLATASASIVSWKLPFSVGIPILGTVRLGATLYSRSQAPIDPNAVPLNDIAPLNVGIELSSEGSNFALNIDNPKRIAGFRFDDADAPNSISVETVEIDSLIDESGASTQASDISVIGVNKSNGTIAFVPAPDTLISILEGEPLTDRARSEAAGFLALYAASPDANVRDGAITALESLENDVVGAPAALESSIAIGQLLQTAAEANRIPDLPNVPEE